MSSRISNANSANLIEQFSGASSEEQSVKTAKPNGEPQPTATPESYVVKPGDTLSKLAERRGISLDAILRSNPQIKNPNKIFAGQQLKLQSGNTGNTKEYTIKRGDTLTEIAKKHNTTIGDLLRANPGQIRDKNLIFPGQKLRVPSSNQSAAQQPKQTTAKPPAQTPTGTSGTNNSSNTQVPVVNETVQAPTNQNTDGALKLGPNEKYKDDLLFAEKITGTKASSLAGLINAEAATKNGVWQADSYNRETNAGGLTQFLPGTWREMATTRGTYLNKIATEKGYVREVNGKPQVINESALQQLRFNPRTSIVTAAQYDEKTLKGAEKLGLVPKNLSSDDKAKYLYYAHHEGPGGVLTHLVSSKDATEEQAKAILTIRFDSKTKAEAAARQHGSFRNAYAAFAEKKARNVFPEQFGNDKSVMNQYVKKYGSYEAGYRAWLTDYTNRKVRPENFREIVTQTTKPQPDNTSAPTNNVPTDGGNKVNQTGMPNTAGMSDSQKFDVYSEFVNKNGNDRAKADLANGKRVILGLRQLTNTHANNGIGKYDDRMIVMWKDKDGKKHVKEVTNANTEPAAYYEDTKANRKLGHNVTKADANGDGRGDLGRLKTGTYEYGKSYAEGFGALQERGKNILRPTTANRVERDSDHDGDFDRADAARHKRNLTDSATMYFHRGGKGAFTGSAGCQTMPQSDFNDFWKSLGSQDKFQYVLVEVK